MAEIEIVKKLHSAPSTPGIIREVAFKSQNMLFVRATTSSKGGTSGWHHHAEHDVYGYLVSGSLRFEYGPGGKITAEAGPGDFFHVSSNMVHRETPVGSEWLAIIAFVCTGPLAVNVALRRGNTSFHNRMRGQGNKNLVCNCKRCL
jgi:quercetin dioxygenase-like cupin family protein